MAAAAAAPTGPPAEPLTRAELRDGVFAAAKSNDVTLLRAVLECCGGGSGGDAAAVSSLCDTPDGGGGGLTPLHYAAAYGHAAVTEALLAAGAGEGLLRGSASAGRSRVVRSPLHAAVAGGHVDVAALLLAAGFSPLTDLDVAGNSALHLVCTATVPAAARLPLLRLVMHHGCDPEAVNFSGHTAVELLPRRRQGGGGSGGGSDDEDATAAAAARALLRAAARQQRCASTGVPFGPSQPRYLCAASGLCFAEDASVAQAVRAAPEPDAVTGRYAWRPVRVGADVLYRLQDAEAALEAAAYPFAAAAAAAAGAAASGGSDGGRGSDSEGRGDDGRSAASQLSQIGDGETAAAAAVGPLPGRSPRDAEAPPSVALTPPSLSGGGDVMAGAPLLMPPPPPLAAIRGGGSVSTGHDRLRRTAVVNVHGSIEECDDEDDEEDDGAAEGASGSGAPPVTPLPGRQPFAPTPVVTAGPAAPAAQPASRPVSSPAVAVASPQAAMIRRLSLMSSDDPAGGGCGGGAGGASGGVGVLSPPPPPTNPEHDLLFTPAHVAALEAAVTAAEELHGDVLLLARARGLLARLSRAARLRAGVDALAALRPLRTTDETAPTEGLIAECEREGGGVAPALLVEARLAVHAAEAECSLHAAVEAAEAGPGDACVANTGAATVERLRTAIADADSVSAAVHAATSAYTGAAEAPTQPPCADVSSDGSGAGAQPAGVTTTAPVRDPSSQLALLPVPNGILAVARACLRRLTADRALSDALVAAAAAVAAAKDAAAVPDADPLACLAYPAPTLPPEEAAAVAAALAGPPPATAVAAAAAMGGSAAKGRAGALGAAANKGKLIPAAAATAKPAATTAIKPAAAATTTTTARATTPSSVRPPTAARAGKGGAAGAAAGKTLSAAPAPPPPPVFPPTTHPIDDAGVPLPSTPQLGAALALKAVVGALAAAAAEAREAGADDARVAAADTAAAAAQADLDVLLAAERARIVAVRAVQAAKASAARAKSAGSAKGGPASGGGNAIGKGGPAAATGGSAAKSAVGAKTGAGSSSSNTAAVSTRGGAKKK
jgi:hypothetical protein